MSYRRDLLMASLSFLFPGGRAFAQAASVQDSTTVTAGPGKATVIISITHDEDTGNKGWTTVYIDGRATGPSADVHALSSIDTVMGIPRGSDFKDLYGRVYVVELPAGPHQIDAWYTSVPFGHVAPVSDPPPLRFDVAAGDVVYLGNVHMVNRLERPSFMSPWVPVGGTPAVRDRQRVDMPIAEAKAPALKGNVQIRLLPLGTWGPEDPPARTLRTPPPNIILKPR